ncbi:MAG: DUF448 domain-containing protein [Ghiorsea sp.]
MLKKAKQRTCFACKQTGDKASFLRLVVDAEGIIWPDFSAKLPGRGVYLCLEEDCLKRMSDKRMGVLQRDFSPQSPQWEVLLERMFDMLAQRLNQLISGMKRGSTIGRDAVMHEMWNKKPLLVVFAADAGESVLRQVKDAVEKRVAGESKSAARVEVVVSLLDANGLGQALGREKVSVVAFSSKTSLEKLQQICVWQRRIYDRMSQTTRENKVTNG